MLYFLLKKRLSFFYASLFVVSPLISFAGITVVNGLSHHYKVIPGEMVKGDIELQNSGSDVKTVKIYQRDYTFNQSGEAFYDLPGTLSRSNAGWIDVSQAFITLQPGQQAIASYEIHVPEDNQMLGTYWSVIMVEEMAPVSTEEIEKSITVSSLIRYAVQIATTISGTGKKELRFTGVDLKKEEGTSTCWVDIENPGECLLRPKVSIELFNESGISAGVFDSQNMKIYPGTSARFFIELKDVSPGRYQAVVLADCEDENVFGINLEMTISDE